MTLAHSKFAAVLEQLSSNAISGSRANACNLLHVNTVTTYYNSLICMCNVLRGL